MFPRFTHCLNYFFVSSYLLYLGYSGSALKGASSLGAWPYDYRASAERYLYTLLDETEKAEQDKACPKILSEANEPARNKSQM